MSNVVDNFFLNGVIIAQTLLLFLSTRSKSGKIIPILTLVILFILSLFILINHFDRNIFNISTIESIRIGERKEYFGQELGKLYKNRVGIFYFDNLRLYSSKISSNFFSILDLSSYFSPDFLFGKGKYPLIFAPLFILGAVTFLANIRLIHLIYLLTAAVVSGFTSSSAQFGLLLILPFVNLLILIGLLKLLVFARNILQNRKS